MDKEKQELLETFGKLDEVNQQDVLRLARTVFVTQENTKKAIAKEKEEKTA